MSAQYPQPEDIPRRRRARTLTATACALFAGLALTACGGGDDDGADSASKAPTAADKAEATALYKKAFAANDGADSGYVTGNVTIKVTGVKRFAEPIQLNVSGPYSGSSTGPSDFEFTVGMRLSDGAYGAKMTNADGQTYLSLGTTGYKLPPDLNARLQSGAQGGKNGLMRATRPFGIAPDRWGRNARIVGVETIEGTKVVHLSGDISIKRFLEDTNRLLSNLGEFQITAIAGLPQSIPSAASATLVRSTTSATGDIFVGEGDDILRRAKLTWRFKVKPADRRHVAGIRSGSVVATLNVTEVGEPQNVKAPATLMPYSQAAGLLKAVGDQVREDLAKGG